MNNRRRCLTITGVIFLMVFSVVVSVASARNLVLPSVIRGDDALSGYSKVLRNASEGEKINLFIQGYGGQATAAFRFMTDLRITKANVTCIVNGPVYSAHSLIALACNNLVISPFSFFMVHGVQGNGNGSHRDAYNELQRPLLERILSTKEINELFKDSEKSLYLNGKEVLKRLKK